MKAMIAILFTLLTASAQASTYCDYHPMEPHCPQYCQYHPMDPSCAH